MDQKGECGKMSLERRGKVSAETHARGFVLSIDTIAASLVLSLFLITLLQISGTSINGMARESAQSEKMLLLAAASEALVKNRNAATPALGSAHYNAGKMRVESNVLDRSLLEKARPAHTGKYFVSAVFERTEHGRDYFFSSQGKNCISAERFVLIEPGRAKAVIGVVLCEK
ncbi:Uncharacterised protein [uncultured archaeon]|nr:Uncharacterised protein [uncultured archaeon]